MRGLVYPILFALSAPAATQDATMRPMAAPAEPAAIPLRSSGGAGTTAFDAWFSQFVVAMVRNVSAETLPEPGKRPARRRSSRRVVAC